MKKKHERTFEDMLAEVAEREKRAARAAAVALPFAEMFVVPLFERAERVRQAETRIEYREELNVLRSLHDPLKYTGGYKEHHRTEGPSIRRNRMDKNGNAIEYRKPIRMRDEMRKAGRIRARAKRRALALKAWEPEGYDPMDDMPYRRPYWNSLAGFKALYDCDAEEERYQAAIHEDEEPELIAQMFLALIAYAIREDEEAYERSLYA